MDRNIDKYGKSVEKEKIMYPFDRPSIPFIVEGVFDNGASYTKKKIVVLARSEYDAKMFARRHLEKHSDDCFKIEKVRAMTEEDVVVEDI